MVQRYSGPNHAGSAHSSPYPTSRLAPAVSLVDVAAQIEHASQIVAQQTSAQLQQIAEQIQQLQEQARALLEKARRDLELHGAQSNCQKRPGSLYHFYQRADGTTFLSLLSPDDYGGQPPSPYVGCFRFEPDQTWTAIDEIARRDATRIDLQPLLGTSKE